MVQRRLLYVTFPELDEGWFYIYRILQEIHILPCESLKPGFRLVFLLNHPTRTSWRDRSLVASSSRIFPWKTIHLWWIFQLAMFDEILRWEHRKPWYPSHDWKPMISMIFLLKIESLWPLFWRVTPSHPQVLCPGLPLYSQANPVARFLILDIWGALLSLLILTLGVSVLSTGAGSEWNFLLKHGC